MRPDEDEDEDTSEGWECSECGVITWDPEYYEPPTCKQCARAIERDNEDEDEDA